MMKELGHDVTDLAASIFNKSVKLGNYLSITGESNHNAFQIAISKRFRN